MSFEKDLQDGGAFKNEDQHVHLDKDDEDKIAEETEEEEELGQELEDDLVVVALQDLVPQAQHHAEGHVYHTEDERYLHLVGVEEANLVLGRLPDRVYAKGIRVASVFSRVRIREMLLVEL